MAGIHTLLDPANPVHQALRSRLDPGALEIFVTAVRQQRPIIGLLGHEADRKTLERIDVGNLPGLRRIGDIAIGQQHHRSHILHRDPHRFDGAVESVFG